MTAAAPIPALRRSALAVATPGRATSLALHLVAAAALLSLPRPHEPPAPQVVDIVLPPPPEVPPPEPTPKQPPPQQRVTPRPPTPAPPQDVRSTPTPPVEAEAPARFEAQTADRAEALAPAAAATTPALKDVTTETPWVGAAADRAETIAPAAPSVTPRGLAEAKAAPETLEFKSEAPPSPNPGVIEDARKKAEEEARRQAGLKAPTAPGGDAPIATGGGSSLPAGGGGAPAARGASGGGGAAIRGIVVDGLNSQMGCDNPDDPRLSDAERAACNRTRWAGAKSAPQLGAVRPKDQGGFDAARAAKAPPTTVTPVASCKGGGASGSLDCLPDTSGKDTSKKN